MSAQRTPSVEEARAFLEATTFVWHQRFDLVPGVETNGSHLIAELFERGGVAEDLTGKRVLDIGATNGGAAFEMERRGADRIVAIDVYPPDRFGFDELSRFLGSKVEFIQGTVYDLSRLVAGETFDYVLFWGVLYHLRHPLLALDEVRAVLAPEGRVDIETAVSDDLFRSLSEIPAARFYRGDELGADPSNWFTPTIACLKDWCRSSGLVPEQVDAWGEGEGKRSMVVARRSPGEPEFVGISYEVPLRAEPVERRAVWPIRG